MAAGSPPRAAADETKTCNKCGEPKPRSEFHARRASADGLSYTCKACAKARTENWTRANQDRVAERRTSPEGRRRKAEHDRRYNERHREQIAAVHAAYYETNRETLRIQQAARYAEIKAQVLAHYGEVCACCSTAENLTIDHVAGDGAQHRAELFGDPRKGGERFYYWLIANGFPPGYQTLCRACNQSKGRGDRCRIHEAPGST